MQEVSLLSKYRTELMGGSMLMIMVYHTMDAYVVDCSFVIPGLSFMPFLGWNIGVDFFLILSAIGCYYSLDRRFSVLPFYRRRIVRVLPAVYIVLFFRIAYDYIVGHHASFIDTIWRLSLLNFFRGKLEIWFITHIAICYLMMPFLYRCVQKKWSHYVFPVLCIASFICLYTLWPQTSPLNVSFYRYPIFIFSLLLAKYCKNNNDANIYVLCGAGLVAIIAYLLSLNLNIWSSMFIAFFFISIPLLLFIAVILEKIRCSLFLHSLSFIGSISLELYMIHQGIAIPLATHLGFYSPVGCMLVSIPFAIVMAYALNLFIKKLWKNVTDSRLASTQT